MAVLTDEARHARDATIRRLALAGWSIRDIAREVGVTHPRVVQILARCRAVDRDVDAILEAEEQRLEGELAALLAEQERLGREIATRRAALRRLDEEREARRIDRLLGLRDEALTGGRPPAIGCRSAGSQSGSQSGSQMHGQVWPR